jgi:hypothetical protein
VCLQREWARAGDGAVAAEGAGRTGHRRSCTEKRLRGTASKRVPPRPIRESAKRADVGGLQRRIESQQTQIHEPTVAKNELTHTLTQQSQSPADDTPTVQQLQFDLARAEHDLKTRIASTASPNKFQYSGTIPRVFPRKRDEVFR